MTTRDDELQQEKLLAIKRAKKFERDVNNDLNIIDERINNTRLKIEGYNKLLIHIKSINNCDQELLVNLGEGVNVKADIMKRNMILVNVGLGFYLECNLKEAQDICYREIQRLENDINVDLLEIAKRKATLALNNEGKNILQTQF